MQRTVIMMIILVTLLSAGNLFAVKENNTKPWKGMDYDLRIPTKNLRYPCLVICPGRGYHKDLPLVKDFALQAKANGFAVVTFNWSFYKNKENPSLDGSSEIADIENILALVKQDRRIDSDRIYIAGKSLGSIFAYNAFNLHKELKGCVLLTPLLTTAQEGNSYYPDLTLEKRPVLFILGDRDGANCPHPELFTYLGTCSKSVSALVLSGGHGMEVDGNKEDLMLKDINKHNLRLTLEAAVLKLKVWEFERQ